MALTTTTPGMEGAPTAAPGLEGARPDQLAVAVGATRIDKIAATYADAADIATVFGGTVISIGAGRSNSTGGMGGLGGGGFGGNSGGGHGGRGGGRSF